MVGKEHSQKAWEGWCGRQNYKLVPALPVPCTISFNYLCSNLAIAGMEFYRCR